MKSDNLDSYTEEKDKPNKIDKNESTREEIDKNINIKKEVDEIENKQLEVVSTKTNENDIMGKKEIKDANAQQLLQFWTSDDVIIHIICTMALSSFNFFNFFKLIFDCKFLDGPSSGWDFLQAEDFRLRDRRLS